MPEARSLDACRSPRGHGHKRALDSPQAELVAAASSLMRETDTIEVSLTDIAKVAGVSVGLVRYHFGNKEGLMLALLERDIARGRDSLLSLLDRDDLSPAEKMRCHLVGMVNAFRELPYLNTLLHALTRDASDETVARIGAEVIRPIVQGQARLLEEGYQAGEFRQVFPQSFFFSVLGATRGIYTQRFVMGAAYGVTEIDDDLHKKNRDNVVDLLMNGILAQGEKR